MSHGWAVAHPDKASFRALSVKTYSRRPKIVVVCRLVLRLGTTYAEDKTSLLPLGAPSHDIAPLAFLLDPDLSVMGVYPGSLRKGLMVMPLAFVFIPAFRRHMWCLADRQRGTTEPYDASNKGADA